MSLSSDRFDPGWGPLAGLSRDVLQNPSWLDLFDHDYMGLAEVGVGSFEYFARGEVKVRFEHAIAFGRFEGGLQMLKAWRQAGEEPGDLRPLQCLFHRRAKIDMKSP